MINRSRVVAAFVVIGIFFDISPVMGANFTTGAQSAKKFGTHEIVLVGNEWVPNPFDTAATVTFTPPSGGAKAVTVRAFYDGGTTWRARVYVTEAGVWLWTSYSLADPGLHGKSGTFNAEISNLRGMLRKHPSNQRALSTDDGRWFLPISDTAWYLLHSQEALWQQYVREDVDKGINVLGPVGALGSPFTGPDQWGAGHSTGNNPWPGGASPEYKDYKRYDLGKFQEAERRIIWIFDNYPEVYIRSLLFGFEMQFQWARLLPSVRRNTLEYMIARWSALPNLFWLVSDDQYVDKWEESSKETLAFNREVGSFFARHEPWKHLMSTQPSRMLGFPLLTPNDFEWVDYINIQDSNGPGAEQIRKYGLEDIPLHVMLGEDYYEQDHGDPPSGYSDPRFYMRWCFWSWILSGGSYTYGGRWGVLHPYSQTGRADLAWTGAGKKNYTGHPLAGLDSVPYIGTYFRDREIDLGYFVPNDEMVRDSGHPTGHAWRPKLMRRGMEEFLIYHPNAAPGSSPGPRGVSTARVNPANTASMKIDLTSAQGTYRVEWYRPQDGVVKSSGIIQGGGQRDLVAPWRGYDVVLRLTRMMK